MGDGIHEFHESLDGYKWLISQTGKSEKSLIKHLFWNFVKKCGISVPNKAGWIARNNISTQLLCETCAILGWLKKRIYGRNKQPVSNTATSFRIFKCLEGFFFSFGRVSGYSALFSAALSLTQQHGKRWASRQCNWPKLSNTHLLAQ